MTITVAVEPRSRAPETIAKRPDGVYEVRVAAPPADGAANAAVCAIVAGHFRVAKSRVRLLKGMKGRLKVIEIK